MKKWQRSSCKQLGGVDIAGSDLVWVTDYSKGGVIWLGWKPPTTSDKTFVGIARTTGLSLLDGSIRKYSSTFYVRMGWVQNGRLYLGAALRKPQQSEPKHLQTKSFAILLLKAPQEFFYPTQKLITNLKILILLSFFLLFLLCSLFFFITHN